MEIKRDVYLNRLINKKNNGLIKVITGIRRCGKSYLLDPIFKNHLSQNGLQEDRIIKIELDRIANKKYYKVMVKKSYLLILLIIILSF